MSRTKQTPRGLWRQKAASRQGTQPQEALLARYRSSVSRYQNPQSRIRKANPHAESVDHPVDRSAIPNFVVPICDRCPAKVGLANIPSYPMCRIFGFIVIRLICAGLNLKNMSPPMVVGRIYRRRVSRDWFPQTHWTPAESATPIPWSPAPARNFLH